MNIYYARAMQKYLYKRSNARFKRTRVIHSTKNPEKIGYAVYHLLGDEAWLEGELLGRIYEDIQNGILVVFGASTKEKSQVPEGLYLTEIIEID